MQTLSAIVTDLDGSLLGGSLLSDANNLISCQDVATIKQLKRQSIPTFVVTGRPFPFAMEVLDQIGFDLPLCACNGGHIYNFRTKETIYIKPIPADITASMVRFLQENRLPFMLYTQSGVVFSAKDEGRHPYWAAQNLLFQPKNRFEERFLTPDFDFARQQVIKILLQLSPDDLIVADLRRLFNREGRLSLVPSGKRFLDINDAGVNKGYGVTTLSRLFGFDLAHTLALGDNYNDEPMLRVAGIPVAPENAEPSIKAMAKFITAPNTQSPLTHAVRQLFPKLLEG